MQFGYLDRTCNYGKHIQYLRSLVIFGFQSFLQEHLDNPGKIADQWNSVSGYYNTNAITTIALEPQNIDKNRDRTVLPCKFCI